MTSLRRTVSRVPVVVSSRPSSLVAGFLHPNRLGLVMSLLAAVLFGIAGAHLNNDRPDFFYLADAFLHGRTWLTDQLGPWDVVAVGSRVYVPFAPFPAIALVPLVAIAGVQLAAMFDHLVTATLGGAIVFAIWVLTGRMGLRDSSQRLAVVVFVAFSSPMLWLATRSGVWDEGELWAGLLLTSALIEASGRRRPWLLGLLGGAAFLSRATLLLTLPLLLVATLAGPSASTTLEFSRYRNVNGARAAAAFAAGLAPSFIFAALYNLVRFGSPLESGYALASLPRFLDDQRAVGLFSLAHLPMNLDYLLWHLPAFQPVPPFVVPDGLGMTVLLTSPAAIFALTSVGRRTAALWISVVAVLTPDLLYYGGGWIQYGFRYFFDVIPLIAALLAIAIARHGAPIWFRVLLWVGVIVNAIGIYWAYRL